MLATRYITRIISLTILALMLNGCKKDFLDIIPRGYLIAQKTSDYDLMLNDASTLSELSTVPYVMMSDELAAADNFFFSDTRLTDQKAFKWDDDLYLPTVARSEFVVLNQQLYIYNKIINEVMTSNEGGDLQKKAIRAEALGGRAYTYFMLANFYGKPYNSSTSATDLGTPLTKIADVTQTKFTRATVKEMYDQVISDLNEAIPDLPPIVSNRIRMSKAAGEALLGKVYVFMARFEDALPLLNAAINDLQNATTLVGLYDLNKELTAGGVFYPIDQSVGPPRSNAYRDKEIVYLKRVTNQYYFLLSAAILSPETVALFSKQDQRLLFTTPYPLSSSKAYPLGMVRAYGKGYSNLGINVADIYLLKAECSARLGDLGSASTALLAFRKTRMPATAAIIPQAITNDKILLTKFILDERIREFAMNGDRWFDMRRLSVDLDYKDTIGKTHRVYNENGNVVETYTLRPERLTLRIPLYVMAANPEMPQNP